MRELTSEEEERIIDRISREVMSRGLEGVTVLFLESIKPVAFIGTQLAMIFIAPLLSVFGDLGIDYIQFFDKHENVERLLKRIEDEIKVRDREKRQAKEEERLLSDKFDFQLKLLPGFSLRKYTNHDGANSALIEISRKESAGGGFLAISVAQANLSPNNLSGEITTFLEREDARQALVLSQDIGLSKLESKQNVGKIRGHRVSMATYEWSNQQCQKGIVEGYELWCDKTNRHFVLSMRTGPLTGQKNERNQTEDLRLVLVSLRCH